MTSYREYSDPQTYTHAVLLCELFIRGPNDGFFEHGLKMSQKARNVHNVAKFDNMVDNIVENF